MDPVYSTQAFYDALVEVDGYQDLTVTEAAQAVQRSGFPDAYAQHEARARAWANAMYGYAGGAITCTLPEPSAAGDPALVVARVERDFASLVTSVPQEGVVDVDATPMAGSAEDTDRMAWAVAHWAVSVASPLEITQVQQGGTVWSRAEGTWAPVEGEPLPTGTVRITVAACPAASGAQPERLGQARPLTGHRGAQPDRPLEGSLSGRWCPGSRGAWDPCRPGAGGRSSWPGPASSRATGRSSRASGRRRRAG